MSFAQVAKQHVAASNTTTTTWNGAVSHAATGNARVDFFYGSLRGVAKERFLTLLQDSYNEDALHTLKLVAYVRDCRGGKGEREIGRYALEWLAKNQPRALTHNLKEFIGKYGRFDDPMALMDSKVEKDALELLRLQLTKDLATLKKKESSDDYASISLCAKWIPSEKKALDKKLKMNKKLSRHMGITRAELRKTYLSPLRAELRLLERHMCAKEWDAIELNKVPSMAMHIHGKPQHAFERHIPEKFAEYKKALATGKTKVNAKVLFPHQIVAEYLGRRNTLNNSVVDELLEAQWKVLVEDAAKTGDLKKTLVLSDVSGSMCGRPMEVSIALGLLVSSLAHDEYKDLVLTFESQPKFHHIVGSTLFERVGCLARARWGGSTNFAAAFRAILKLAKGANLQADQMPQRLIVVSDMQFNSADSKFETNYDTLKRDFEAAGYEVPHLVFWNVNGSVTDFPTFWGQAKVSLISGFSTAILKSVLTGVELTPLQTVLNVVLDARYDSITLPPQDEEEGMETTSEVNSTHGSVDDGVLL